MDPLRIMQSSMDDILFEHRNKSYGAYTLRKYYPDNLEKAVISAIVLFTLVFISPAIARYFKTDEAPPLILEKVVSVTLENPVVLEKVKVQEIPVTKKAEPAPQADTKRYVPVEVRPDDQVTNEENPPTQNDLKNTQISSETKAGDPTTTTPVEIETPGTGNGTDVPVKAEEKKDEIYRTPEQMPEFEGGDAAMKKWIAENVRYPDPAKEAGIEGSVIVTFIVDENGNVTSPSVLRGLGGGLNEESLRVIRKMPKWKAGKQQGRPVKVKLNLPIKFRLQ